MSSFTNTVSNAINRPLMDLSNIPAIIADYVDPLLITHVNITVKYISYKFRGVFASKTHTFSFAKFESLLKHKPQLIKEILNSGIACIEFMNNQHQCFKSTADFGQLGLFLDNTNPMQA